MKNVLLLVALVLVVAACNLTDKFKKSDTSNSNSSSSSGNPSKIGDDPVEQPNPTAAQTAALANGQSVKWDQQGITWTLPANWKKQTVTNDSFNYGADGAFLIVSISPMAPDFPTDISLKAFHEGAKVRSKNGQVDEVKWLELDGVRGVEFRESKPQMADDIRRLQWMTYRKYAGQTQLVNFILSGSGDNFAKHQDELYAILFSTKLVH
ncbi:MAG: hypothetical protein QOH71_1359 [Blastocatellia bacterium]|jgi:hypothetical protein|nr:hypothetical protein [Blastocatellia bacterium]